MPASGPARDTPLPELQQIAKSLRRRMLAMAAHKGEGYIAQGLGIADALAVVYFRELALDAARFDDPDRDRFILSTGHYSIALYAVLARTGRAHRQRPGRLRAEREPAADEHLR